MNGHLAANGLAPIRTFIDYWRFWTILAALVTGLAFGMVRYRVLVEVQEALQAEVSIQSMADSVSVVDRWQLRVGITFLVCSFNADTIQDQIVRREARRGCTELLRFTPAIRNGEVPAGPATRVWRPGR